MSNAVKTSIRNNNAEDISVTNSLDHHRPDNVDSKHL